MQKIIRNIRRKMKQAPLKLNQLCAIVLVFAMIFGAVFNSADSFGLRATADYEDQAIVSDESWEGDTAPGDHPAYNEHPEHPGGDIDDTEYGGGYAPGDYPAYNEYPGYPGGDIGDTEYGQGYGPGAGGDDRETEYPEEEFTPGVSPALSFSFNGNLYISPSKYANAASRAQLFLSGVYVTDENEQCVGNIQVWDDGGFNISAPAGTAFTITYAAPHPASGEVFTGQRTATVVHDVADIYERQEEPEREESTYEEKSEYEEELETEITFEFEGALAIDMSELYERVDLKALLLQGIVAVDESGEYLTHLVTIADDGGFAQKVMDVLVQNAINEATLEVPSPLEIELRESFGAAFEPVLEVARRFGALFGENAEPEQDEAELPQEQEATELAELFPEGGEFVFTTYVTYAATHPEDGEEFLSEPRAVTVNFEIIAPFSGRQVTFLPTGGNFLEMLTDVPHIVTLAVGATTLPAVQLPQPPARPGFAFRHWNTQETLTTGSGGALFTTGATGTYIPDTGLNVYAQWGREVTFDLNWVGAGANPTNRIIPHGYSVNTMAITPDAPEVTWPPIPARPAYDFVGWFATGDPVPFDANREITTFTALHAQWVLSQPYTVVFCPDGGTAANAGEPLIREVMQGRTIVASNAPPYNLNPGIPAAIRNTSPVVTRPRPPHPTILNSVNTTTLADNAYNLTAREWRRIDVNNPQLPHHSHWFATPPQNLGTVVQRAWANPVTREVTIRIRWVYAINFMPNAGTFTNNSPGSVDIPIIAGVTDVPGGVSIAQHGHRGGNQSAAVIPVWNTLPTVQRDGFMFMGWWNMDIPTGTRYIMVSGERVPAHDTLDIPHPTFGAARQLTANCMINSSGRVFAWWIPNPPATVNFHLNAGNATWHPTPVGENGIRNIVVGASIRSYFGTFGIATPPLGQGMPRFPSRPGFIFGGWFECQSGTGPRFDQYTVVNAPVTNVYARWLPFQTVRFNTLGSTAPNFDRLLPVGAPYNTFGFMHQLWGSGVDPIHLNSGAHFVNHYLLVETNIMSNVPANHGVHGMVPLDSRANHRFFRWNTEPDGTGERLNSNTALTPTAGISDVYAMWAPRISFNDNHSYLGGSDGPLQTRYILPGRSISTQNQHPNAPPNVAGPIEWGNLTMPAPPPSATHSFVGWNRAQDGSGAWFTADTVIGLHPAGNPGSYLGEGPFTVYAQWSQGIAFDPGWAPSPPLQTTQNGIPRYVILEENSTRQMPGFGINYFLSDALPNMPPAPYWYRHNFRHWASASVGGTVFTSTAPPITGPMTLFAQWSTYLRFDANGGAFANGDLYRNWLVYIGVPMGVRYIGSLPPRVGPNAADPWLGGWQFAEWNDAQDGSGQTYTNTAPDVPSFRPLYAQWQADVVFVNREENGVPIVPITNAVPAARTNLRSGAQIWTAPAPPHALLPVDPVSFSFLGWYTTPHYVSGTVCVPFGQVTTMTGGNRRYYARWDTLSVQLTLVLAQGSQTFGRASVTAPNFIGGGTQSREVPTVPGGLLTAAVMEVEPGATVTINANLLSNVNPNLNWAAHPDWFTLSITGAPAIAPTPAVALAANGTYSGTFVMPSVNTTVTVTFTPMTNWGFRMPHANLNYGAHVIDVVTPQTITLSHPNAVTDPADVNFTVFNGANAPNWQLRVRAEVPTTGPSAGNNQLFNRLYLDNGGNIRSINGIVFTQLTNQLLTFIEWNDLIARVVVETLPGQPPLAGAHQADLIWSVHTPISP